jgi:NADPH:quinone reductase-like Zn-dependent oxidoreductase
MKAWGIQKYKGELQIIDAEEPSLGSNDVLIEVHSVGLNHLDEMLRNGEFKALLPLPLPLILGNELAGVVIATGKNVSGFQVGDEVFAKPDYFRSGTLAERISIDANEVALKPKNLSMMEAGSVPLVALTAWQALVEEGQLTKGQSVLIQGGSGGVGSIAIQIAKHLGAYVAATSSAANASYVRSLGADLVIDYKTEDFTKLIMGYDLVLDHLGGENLIKSLSVLKPGGKAIGIAGPPDPELARKLNRGPFIEFIVGRISAKVRQAAKKFGVTYRFLFVSASGEQLTKISKLIESGTITTKVAKTVAFEFVPSALADLNKGRGEPGKTVIDFESSQAASAIEDAAQGRFPSGKAEDEEASN